LRFFHEFLINFAEYLIATAGSSTYIEMDNAAATMKDTTAAKSELSYRKLRPQRTLTPTGAPTRH
jgi:hypothetical protein